MPTQRKEVFLEDCCNYKMLSQMMLLCVLFLQMFEDMEVVAHTIISSSSSLDSWCYFLKYLFDRALFLQCSHVTSMQSPYVLNSNVVTYRRILHKPLS